MVIKRPVGPRGGGAAPGRFAGKGARKMARLFVCEDVGGITVDIEAGGQELEAALEHEAAELVIRCAVLMALSALVEGETWPTAALETMSAFMSGMRNHIRADQLM